MPAGGGRGPACPVGAATSTAEMGAPREGLAVQDPLAAVDRPLIGPVTGHSRTPTSKKSWSLSVARGGDDLLALPRLMRSMTAGVRRHHLGRQVVDALDLVLCRGAMGEITGRGVAVRENVAARLAWRPGRVAGKARK